MPKQTGFIMLQLIAGLTVRFEAVTAVYGTIAAGLEGNLGVAAATIADNVKHLTLGAVNVLIVLLTASRAASGATAGLILEALVGEELLLGSGEHELIAASTAYQSLVFVHG